MRCGACAACPTNKPSSSDPRRSMQIEALAVEMPRMKNRAHPNRTPFRGVLTVVDEPSQRPPTGARGHRVVLTRAAAEAGLPSLNGMGLEQTQRTAGQESQAEDGEHISVKLD